MRPRNRLGPKRLPTLVMILALVLGVGAVTPLPSWTSLLPAAAAQPECMATSWPPALLASPELAREGLSSPSPTTIAGLVSLTHPADGAIDEPTYLSLEGIVEMVKLGGNGTLQAVVSDPIDPSQTLIADFLEPACLATRDSVLAQQVEGARDALADACGGLKLKLTGCGARARIIAVGVFNPDPDAVTGAASNGFELGPVFSFKATGGASSGELFAVPVPPRPGAVNVEPRRPGVPSPPADMQPATSALDPAPPAPPPPVAPARVPPVAALQPPAPGVQPASPGLQPSVPARPMGPRKILSGVGSQDTQPFLLDPVPYTINWAASTAGTDAVNFAGFLKPSDPSSPGWIFVANTIIGPGGNQSGTVQVAGVPGGAYYLNAIGGSAWTVTITRVRGTRPDTSPPDDSAPAAQPLPGLAPNPSVPSYPTPTTRRPARP